MQIPIVDFNNADESQLAQKIDHALTDIGFMVVTGLGVDRVLLNQVYRASKQFFCGTDATKQRCLYRSA